MAITLTTPLYKFPVGTIVLDLSYSVENRLIALGKAIPTYTGLHAGINIVPKEGTAQDITEQIMRPTKEDNTLPVVGAKKAYVCLSEHKADVLLGTTVTQIITGHDLTVPKAKLIITVRDTGTAASPGRPWPDAIIDLDAYKESTHAFEYLSIYDNDHIRIYLDDLKAGTIRLSAHGRAFTYVKSELLAKE